MEAHCIDVERIGEVVDLPEDHPRRRHAQVCPRCRSLLESYVEFMKAEPLDGSRVENARPLLDARIREAAARWSPSESRTSSLARDPWWRGLFKPAPMLATAAVVMVAAVFVWTSTRNPEESVLRDDATQTTSFVPAPAEIDADGSMHLSWTPVPSADAYQVRIYGPDLVELARLPETAETSTVLARSVLPGDLPAALDLTWRVYALSGGDVIQESAPGSIRIP